MPTIASGPTAVSVGSSRAFCAAVDAEGSMTDVRTSGKQPIAHLAPATPMPTQALEHQVSLTDWLSLDGEEEHCNQSMNYDSEVSNQVRPTLHDVQRSVVKTKQVFQTVYCGRIAVAEIHDTG